MRILVVDDELEMRELLGRNLGRTYGVKSVGTCKEAVAMLAHAGFDVLILDVMLPDGSGIDLCGKLRTDGIELFPEGTIRGTGGLRIAGERCETTIPGLFAAGDTAIRELIAGATTGGGSPNSAWALTSGLLSGAGAAALAQSRGRRLNSKVRALGTVGLRPRGSVKAVDRRSVLKAAQDEILPLEKNVFRSGDKLRHSLRILESAWRELREHDRAIGTDAVSARETASVVATARLCYTAALTRDERRGMHQREDVPEQKTEQQRRLLIGGLDDVWTRPEASAQWSPSHV